MLKKYRNLIIFVVAMIIIAGAISGAILGYNYWRKIQLQKMLETATTYKDFKPINGFSCQYPNWPTLNLDILNRFISNTMPPELYSRNKILIGVADGLGAQTIISRRQLTKEEAKQPFGNIVKDVQKKEQDALLNAGAIQDFKIIDEQYGEQNVYIESRSIDGRGVGYINLTKSFLVNSDILGINNKYIYSLSFSAPERYIDNYTDIINHLMNSAVPQ